MPILASLLFAGLCALQDGTNETRDRWAFQLEEQAVQRLWLDTSRRFPRAGSPSEVAFEHASVLSMASPEIQPDRTVWIRDGRIAEIAAKGASTVPAGVPRIDASGKFLMPGLVDMHVHTSTSSSGYLLDLAVGVTGVREMCGFPWMLRRREAARAGKLLAPRLAIAGHILNAFPMDMYATVVNTPEEARARVREQVAAGYDFIKVHNSLPLETYRAIADESKRLGVRMVGHVPHDVTLAEAFAVGQHTQEHFKGIILDSTLEMTDEDWTEVLKGKHAFLCPTLYTRRTALRGEALLRVLDAPEMRYVPARDRARWRERAQEPQAADSHDRVWELSQDIFRELVGSDVIWLAGTDSGGGYPNMVSGFALHDELATMVKLGLSPYEALRAATVNAAQALDRADESGTLERGKLADLVLLDANPLTDLGTLARPAGVMAGGTWLSREALTALLDALAALYARPMPPVPDAQGRAAFLAEMEAQAAAGMVFMDHHLEDLADLLASAGDAENAQRVRARESH